MKKGDKEKQEEEKEEEEEECIIEYNRVMKPLYHDSFTKQTVTAEG